MKTFNFYKDEKVTIWNREHFTVEAETQEEANIKVLEAIKNGDISDFQHTTSKYMYDTVEELSVDENYGNPTIEIYNTNDKLIYHNAKR